MFKEAEELQNAEWQKYPFLTSLRGFAFCQLLIARGDVNNAIERASTTIVNARKYHWLLDIALDELTLALSYSCSSGSNYNQSEVRDILDRSIAGLRQAGYSDFIVIGLLARAKILRQWTEYQQSNDNLFEAFEVADRGDMLLHLIDIHLEAARLAMAMGGLSGRVVLDETGDNPPALAEDHIAIASNLIDKTGYGRRKPDLALVRARLAIAKDDREEAKRQLNIAARYVEEGWKIHEVELKELMKQLS